MVHFLDLSAKGVDYFGPTDLTEYFVKSHAITQNYSNSAMKKESSNKTAVRVEIVLGRRILSQLLTTFLPSTCLCIVAFSTNYFNVIEDSKIAVVKKYNDSLITALLLYRFCLRKPDHDADAHLPLYKCLSLTTKDGVSQINGYLAHLQLSGPVLRSVAARGH